RSCAAIRADYPDLRVVPLHGDFTAPLTLEPGLRRRPLVGFFPGSTLGNFTTEQAIAFLRSARTLLGPDARFLLGVDMRKDAATLVAAYDDAGGVTAAFNLNLLARMRRELGCVIDIDAFAHRAIWNDADGRIEMHLVSRRDQRIVIGDRGFDMAAGETIHTENCHKFSLGDLNGLAARSGWTIRNVWTSDAPSYALLMLDAV
ncbi:MAG: L-histidine N(alpha)-methyltransferase, partial [Sphingomonadaceae bacterium]|nr:L-histidine N(alpha)-methyltransferase [Sphingomonadaceae bacterium]